MGRVLSWVALICCGIGLLFGVAVVGRFVISPPQGSIAVVATAAMLSAAMFLVAPIVAIWALIERAPLFGPRAEAGASEPSAPASPPTPTPAQAQAQAQARAEAEAQTAAAQTKPIWERPAPEKPAQAAPAAAARAAAPPVVKDKSRIGRYRNWLLWWNVAPSELDEQLEKYGELKIYQSARGLCLILFVISAVFTTLITELATHQRTAYLDVVLFLVLGGFMYVGQRWAMVAGMILWTLEKALMLLQAFQAGHHASPVGALLFWAMYMHVMFLAYRVERARSNGWEPAAAVFE